MFLDPEPKRRKTSKDMSSGFFSSQRPIMSPKDSAPGWRQKGSAPHSKSQDIDGQGPSQARKPPTVRLVNPSPESSPSTRDTTPARDEVPEGDQDRQVEIQGIAARSSQSGSWKGASVAQGQGRSAAGRHDGVSESYPPSNEAQRMDSSPSITLLPNNSHHELPGVKWHRRSTSSGNYSQSSTLGDSEIALSKKSAKSERFSSLSQISTLRGTPTPYDQESRDRAEGEEPARSGPAQAFQTPVALQETLPEGNEELSTIRTVPPSDTSSPTETGPGSPTPEPPPAGLRSAQTDLEQASTSPRRSPQGRPLSNGSRIPASSTSNSPSYASSPAKHSRSRSDSQATSERTIYQASSPNFIAYSPDSSRPISRDALLRNAASSDSINSRLQQDHTPRPEPRHSPVDRSSSASFESNDTVPPLYVPKKRLRHKPASDSLGSTASAQPGSSSNAHETMADSDIDTLPYPKRPFSSHLSTIASESDRHSHSRSASQHLSHFSLGSGVLTGDDASSFMFSSGDRRRRSSAPINSMSSKELAAEEHNRDSSSEFEEEAGDMTLGVFREESAVPQPLFKTKAVPNMLDTSRKYNGPLPPLPPVPKSRDSDEDFDTLSALQSPHLRQKRSGYSLRQRSNSTPSHSRHNSSNSFADSERFSYASSMFPTWAKHFYSGAAALPSKVSLTSLRNHPGERPAMHGRNQSAYTERSITSRLGTGYSNTADAPSSPASSHFLPAIFRPRTRKQGNSKNSKNSKTRSSHSSKLRKHRRSRTSGDRPSQETTDSMAINQASMRPSQDQYHDIPLDDEDVLPSGQPRWGVLKDNDSPPPGRRPLPRKYSKQKQWDQMEFPRPMTKDRLSDFGVHDAHLAPSTRASQTRLHAWQAPSFASSLDTLITSRHNRQILCFALGFICPLVWMLGAVLPLPKRPASPHEMDLAAPEGSEDDVRMAMMKHEAGDAERRWREEKNFLKGRWWRVLNRIMSVIGLLVIGAVVALVVVALR